MKHLIETAGLSGLPITEYDRIILDSSTDDVIVRGGGGYVDLGLPSGLKWAKCNVGAAKETDCGYYFQWGEIEPHDADTPYDWEHAPFNNGSSSYNSTHFKSVKNTVCPNGILAKEYDTASQIMGGDWRMPTKGDFQELLDNTNSEWVNINGINGRKFTSKTNGNSIFIPAAGRCGGGSVDDVSSYGYVWSSSLYTSGPGGAWGLYFYSGDWYMGSDGRYYGLSVRGVRK